MDIRDRIVEQFSGRSERADVWRALGHVLDTEAFLNLGYSEWYQPHPLPSSQRRLVTVVGSRLAAALPTTEGVHLLDVGCGRGGPAVHLAERFGFDVTGIDLVSYNLARARENAAAAGVDAAFVRGDVTHLPFASGSLPACTAVDALVYVPDRAAAVAALSDVLEPGGVFVFSDLIAEPDPGASGQRALERLAEAWDMPPPGTRREYERALADAGLRVREVRDLTGRSVDRLRPWAALFCRVADGPARGLLEWLLCRWGLDPDAVVRQVRRAREALSHLRHVLFVARKPS
ncbi:MAG: class I SAM-dependent methyltransferase [Haloglomus sp.]